MTKIEKNIGGKVVVITGASSGIGLALAHEFSAAGARVVLAARSVERLQEVANEIEISAPGTTLVVGCDVTDALQCRMLVERSVDRFGGIDILINNAGISMRAILDDVEMEVLRRLMDVNFWGAVYCTKYALPYIQKSRGSIVGVSSVAGIHGLPARSGYSASKYALQGFLDTVRVENLKLGVHVMVVAPGFTESNVRFSALTADGSAQGESPRNEHGMMSAEQVARLIVRATADRKRYLIMDFQGRASYFIKKLWPSLLDRLFYNAMAKEPNSPLK